MWTGMMAATHPGPGHLQEAVEATTPVMTATETRTEEGGIDPTLMEVMVEADTRVMTTCRVTQ